MSAQQLITEHIDLWSSTIKARKTQGRGSRNKRELYGIKKLRELILELAVRGKLVPQDPNDEPAKNLLERIALEKAQLIKDSKIKAQKNLDNLTPKEAAFDLPKGWEWALLPNISSYMTGKTPATKNSVFWGDAPSDYPWVSIADMNHYGRVGETTKKVTQEAVDQVFKYQPVKAGTMLMSFKLTLGKVTILDVDAFHNEAIISISPFTGVCKGYLFRVLPERALAGNSKKAIKGNTLNSESIARISIPLPPVAEQHRIVTKIDELMALCDQLEQQTESSLDAHNLLVDTLLATLTNARDANELSDSWARLADHFDTLITTDYAVEQLKQTVLQLAVQGKLVSQDPSDETASELLKRIGAEKEQLIKDKKIKVQKPLAPISDEEKPFDLPKGWKWGRIGDAISLKNGYAFKSKYFVHEPTPFVLTTPGNFYETGGFKDRGEKTRFYDGEVQSEFILNCDDLIVPMTEQAPGLLGSSAFIPDDGKRYIHNQRLGKLTPYCSCSTTLKFIALFFNSPYLRGELAESCSGTTVRHTSPDRIYKVLFPLLSAAEQQRIVTKVDELISLCDQLKARFNDAQTTQLHLADSVVENALTVRGS